jgi:protein involved in polysaccharide export with SLBB domain
MPQPHVRRVRTLAPAALLLLALSTPVAAQEGLQPTRAELQALLARLEAGEAPRGGDPAAQAAVVRQRLREGDFNPGDQVGLVVEGETTLTGTFTVGPGRTLALPQTGSVTLDGVLRAELDSVLRVHVARYLRDPVVRARALVRVGVTGQVRSPGYYVLPAEALLSDVLMAAGGPLPNARMASARIERGSQRIWDGKGVRQALSAGWTLDQLSLRAGDALVVPNDGGGWSGTVLRAAALIPALVLAVVTVARN